MIMSDTLLTIKEAARKLGVHWQTVRNYIQKEQLKSFKFGRTIRIQKGDLDEFIKNLDTNNKSYIEIEKRYLLHNQKQFVQTLLDLDAEVTYQAHIIDHWFVPAHIRSLKQADYRYNEQRGCGIRLREQDNG